VRGAAWLLATGLLACGCASVPSPLTPGFRGSIGSPAFGVLTESEQLPERGVGFRRLRLGSRRYHGTPALVRTLTDAAARVWQEGEPPLLVGDMAAQGGGPLSGHHSHRTGRDVDLLFYYTTPGGVPVEAPGFVRVGPDGLAEVEGGVFVRFDTPRNWRLVRALLTSEVARPQWIFVVAHLEGLLLEYAFALGEPTTLLWQAENILHQPGDSSPHDDHFHLRIACSDEEVLAGCVTGSPWWPWWPEAPSLEGETSMEGEEPL
jgi:penicillin-insensitive murein endopeptidase